MSYYGSKYFLSDYYGSGYYGPSVAATEPEPEEVEGIGAVGYWSDRYRNKTTRVSKSGIFDDHTKTSEENIKPKTPVESEKEEGLEYDSTHEIKALEQIKIENARFKEYIELIKTRAEIDQGTLKSLEKEQDIGLILAIIESID